MTDQTLAVSTSSTPNPLIVDVTRKGLMSPLIGRSIGDRNNILMGHEKDRFQRGVRTSPGEEMTIGVDRSVIESRVAVSKSVESQRNVKIIERVKVKRGLHLGVLFFQVLPKFSLNLPSLVFFKRTHIVKYDSLLRRSKHHISPVRPVKANRKD